MDDEGHEGHEAHEAAEHGAGKDYSKPGDDETALHTPKAEDAGLASGLVNTTAQVGGALSLAVLATVATSRTTHPLADGHSMASALTSGYHLAFWIAAGLMTSSGQLSVEWSPINDHSAGK